MGAPLGYLLGFIAATAGMIACVNRMERGGLEGTVLGTLLMPYCSGAPNLVFALVMAMKHGRGADVVTNALVNNLTNLSLLIGMPALIWTLQVVPRGKVPKKKIRMARLNRLSLMLNLLGALFFTVMVWVVGKDGAMGRTDGLVLIGIFLFWQLFHVYDVMRTNVETGRKLGIWFWLGFAGMLVGAAVMFVCIDNLTGWLETRDSGLLSAKYIGWLSGWLMVLPNALPAFYYAAKNRADIVYSSQIGDGHICIPLCIGLFAVFRPIAVPSMFTFILAALVGVTMVHLLIVGVAGRLNRFGGLLLIAVYVVSVYWGLAG